MNVRELKDLVRKFGGDPTGKNTVAELLDCLCMCEVGGGGVTHWDDLEGKPFGYETPILYEGYPEYMWGYAKLPFVLRAGIAYDLVIKLDTHDILIPNLTAIENEFGVVTIERTDSTGENSFLLESNDGVSFFYPYGSRFTEGRPENDDTGAYEYTSKVRIQVEFTNADDAGVITLPSEYLPKAEAIADVTETPTAEQFNALLAALRDAGYLAT